MAEVRLEQVEKIYAGGVRAIHPVSLTIKEGELMVMVGPSGCGKSTMLRMIAGLEKITAGEIFIGEQCVNDKEPAERDIAMVFQNYALYPHMTVYDNMAYGLRNRKVPKAEIDQRVREVARILALENLVGRKPRALSGGQRQRVAMGRAIVREPKVFLFDEPLSNLDAKLRVQMRLEIKRLQERLRVTSVYVTHDQVEAMTLGHRLMLLNDGRVEQIGTPMEVYEQPATLFVAGFIGSPAMNFLRGTVDQQQLRLSDTQPLSLPAGRLVEGQEVVVGVRPEHLELCTPNEAQLTLTVQDLERLGADTIAYGQIYDGSELFAARLPGSRTLHSGELLPLRLSDSALHLFDAATGQRL